MNNKQETRAYLIITIIFVILAIAVICNYKPSCTVRYKASALLKKDLLFLDKDTKQYKETIKKIKSLENGCPK
jgi:hypothetical protein